MLKLYIEMLGEIRSMMKDGDPHLMPFIMFVFSTITIAYACFLDYIYSLAGWYSLLIFPIAFFSDYIAAPLIAPSVGVLLSKAWHKVKLIEEEGKEIARMLEERIK